MIGNFRPLIGNRAAAAAAAQNHTQNANSGGLPSSSTRTTGANISGFGLASIVVVVSILSLVAATGGGLTFHPLGLGCR